jgi:hypothetical protein
VITGLRHAPSAWLPLAYLLAAAISFIAAAAAMPWLAPRLAGHYYQPGLVAVTHAITLGWITLAIMGASYQLVPIILECAIRSERLGWIQLALGVAGVVGMVAHFWTAERSGLLCAAGVMAAAIVAHLVNMTLSLRRLVRWTFTARLMVVGLAGLAATTLFGVVLAADRLWPFLPTPFFSTLHAHVHLALLGWVAPVIVGVSTRVYPMFLLATPPDGRLGSVQVLGLVVGVPVLVLGLLGATPLIVPGAGLVVAALASHVAWLAVIVRGRRRPALDWGLRMVIAGAAMLPLVVVLGLGLAVDVLSGPRVALAYAVLALAGWVTPTIAGMMLKIVPFLVWYRAYGGSVGRGPVPTLGDLSWPAAEGMACIGLTAGAVALSITVALGDAALIRVAAALWALGAAAFGAAISRVLLHLVDRPWVEAAAR